MRNMIASLSDYRVMNLNMITRLSYLAQIFPAPFAGNEKILEQMLQLLKKWLEGAIMGFKQMHQVPILLSLFVLYCCYLETQVNYQFSIYDI